ncbi:MAG: helix-turn-helix domain-containing protein [Defluviitaleaceae bacterium]|nr:helix-turn-helix domain-containing protein [Defluviitaleaceae bacterium]
MDIEQTIYESTLYIHKMYAEPITVTDIAAHAYLSPSYFSFLFRTFTGYTVKNYLNRYRLYCAVKDIRESNKQLVEIAYASGFSSQQAFTRSFSQMYGVAPAQFRLLSPNVSPFPAENLWSKGRKLSMELSNCFENVRYMHKEAFYVVGLEADIHYNNGDGTAPIGELWDLWNNNNYANLIPDTVSQGVVYGITHSETVDSKAKYAICVEVTTLDNIPVGLVGRKFEASEYAIFDTTLEIIFTGEFWRAFYSKWLPTSGKMMHEETHRSKNATFCKYPAIEVYKDWENEKSIMQVYAPVVKKDVDTLK